MNNIIDDFFISIKNSFEKKLLVSDRLVLSKYAIQISVIDYEKPLVFTFDSMDTKSSQSIEERSGWGQKFLLALGYNVCSFLESDTYRWYRHKEFYQLIETIKAHNVFTCFPRIITYGSSMGGYAASAFANALNADLAILANPISSLNSDAASFETRFLRSKQADWQGPYYDGVDGIKGIKGYIIYDPLFSLDSKHAKRYLNAHKDMKEVKVFGFGHGVLWHLKTMGLLKPLIKSIITNEYESYYYDFYSALRSRRNLNKYYKFLLSSENSHLTPSRKIVIIRNLLSTYSKLYQKNADYLREVSSIFEESDTELAYILIKMAHQARPKGGVIKQKMNKLSKRLAT